MDYQSAALFTEFDRKPVPRVLLEANTSDVKPVVRLALYLFVFSLPFDLPELGLPLEVTTLTASIFLLSTLLQPRVCFRRPPFAIWCFVVYLYVYVSLIIWNSAQYRTLDLQLDQTKLLFLLFQSIALCWTTANVLREDRTAKGAVLSLAAAGVLLALIHLLGVARTTTEIASNVERLSTFGQNPNTLGRHLSLGLLALIGIAYSRRKAPFRPAFVVWPMVLLVLMAITSTGSRGSLIALGAGLLVFALGKDGAAARFRNVLVVAAAIGLAIWVSYRSETMEQRFERTLNEGSLAHREDIYPVAWKMVLDRPLLGWGPTINMWELGSRIGEPDHRFRDTHNLLLEILTVTGILGAIPFFAGILLCLRAAWKGRDGPAGVLPLALLASILVSNAGANLLYNKITWILLAYALTSYSQFIGPRPSRPAILLRPEPRQEQSVVI